MIFLSSWKSIVGSLKGVFWNLLLITVGSLLCALAINGILIPHKFFGSGFTGISLIIHYLIPTLPMAGLYFMLNVPLFALGWMHVGRRFFLYSIAGMLIFSGALLWDPGSLPVHDKILSAILAGIIVGIGSGIILKSLGSSGGMDILSIILMKRFSVRLGSSILVSNGFILAAGAVLFSLDMALYTLIYLYVNSSIVNLVVFGLSQRKAVFIVTPQWNRVSQEIMENIHRGVTSIPGKGAYTGTEQNILYTVITFRELARLKKIINKIDPHAFVVVTDTLEVMGQRVGNQPHW